MATFQTTQYITIIQQGEIYNATGMFGTFISTDPNELVDGLNGIKEANITDLFGDDTATSWTFVKSDYAEHYDVARLIGPGAASMRGHPAFNPHRIAASLPQELVDAIDWMDNNAKSRCGAWTYPGSQSHYYIFEDPQEALLFKLAVTV